MLEKIPSQDAGRYMNFSGISRYSTGTGLCYVYNAVMKRTKAEKPFITLYLRDINGDVIPGYVFDLQSPLMAGGEVTNVIGKIVKLDWEENYLPNVGLTIIVTRASVMLDAGPQDYARFRGTIEDLDSKRQDLEEYFMRGFAIKAAFPMFLGSWSSGEYCQGRVGGLLEHYWRMSQMLKSLEGLSPEERKQTAATFLLYIFVHSNYVRAHDKGQDDIQLVTSLTDKVSSLAKQMGVGAGSLEVVHMFFGYEPKDIYVRTVAAVSDMVRRFDKEFCLYHTIPLTQEGNAGYGTIRRYQVEGQVDVQV